MLTQVVTYKIFDQYLPKPCELHGLYCVGHLVNHDGLVHRNPKMELVMLVCLLFFNGVL